ncbi:hypothetical protein ACFLZJ_00845 [Nanoarchaeota archaeon]
MKEESKNKLSRFHDKHYKHLLLIPILLLVISAIFMFNFYSNNGDFIYKDVSLSGGTSITIHSPIDSKTLEQDLADQLEEISVRETYNIITGEQVDTIVETKTGGQETTAVLEEYLGYDLNEENSDFLFNKPTLSESFYNQLILAILYAFSFMGIVVFFLFSKKTKMKILVLAITLISPLFFLAFKIISISTAMIIALVTLLLSIIIYIKHNIPSFAVIISAFADILMTLVLANMLGMKMSTAGIVAFLMLIGYSVDTDILLTTRILKRSRGTLNHRIFGAFKTGITMTLTSLLAVVFALVVVKSFSVVLGQIFTILAIGLGFDILNTWITNASILKWYMEKRQ